MEFTTWISIYSMTLTLPSGFKNTDQNGVVRQTGFEEFPMVLLFKRHEGENCFYEFRWGESIYELSIRWERNKYIWHIDEVARTRISCGEVY